MIQRKKNIRLLALLALLIVITVVVALTGPVKNRLDVPRNLFSYENTAEIDQVIIADDTLTYVNRQWTVNGKKADPQRIEVLFAIIQQVKVRRGPARSTRDSLEEAMDNHGVSVRLLTRGEEEDVFRVLGQEDRGTTWMQKEKGEEVYLVEIPGYRSYLGGIFQLDANGWRYPMIYDFNWKNFQSATVEYPDVPDKSFQVRFGDHVVEVTGMEETDTTRLNDFLNDLSLLYATDYLYPAEAAVYDSLTNEVTALLTVTDVGNNHHLMEVYNRPPGTRDMLVRIDSADYALVDYQKVKKLLKPRWFFRKQ